MSHLLGSRRPSRRAAQLLSVLLLASTPALAPAIPVVPVSVVDSAHAATPITVAAARATHNGSSATVRGYVVGQPTSSTTVVTSGFPSDYALALADTAGSTDTSQMVYVQVPSAFRSAWGLKTNPSLMGDRIDVTGTLSAYFSRPGDYDTTYWAPAMGKGGAALESSLHSIISSGVTRLSYDQVWNALKQTDQDPANPSNVIELYTGDSITKANFGGGVDQWNREHVWAKSHGDFGTATGPGTDIHHLAPRTSPSTPTAATSTSTRAAPRTPRRRATTPTATPGSRATRSRATSSG